MGATLAIIERSHRGTVEQQYAHVLWLVHGLHRQSAMVVLLRGGAALYSLNPQWETPLDVGGVLWGSFPDYSTALERLRVDGADVLVEAASLKRFGLDDAPLLPGIVAVNDDEIVRVAAEADRIWYL
jgi:hypothetical protein